MFLMQQPRTMMRLMKSSWYYSAYLFVILSEKYLKSKDFISLTQVFKLLVWVPKIIKTYVVVK